MKIKACFEYYFKIVSTYFQKTLKRNLNQYARLTARSIANFAVTFARIDEINS